MKMVEETEVSFLQDFVGSLDCVVANVLNCNILVSEFEL